MKEKFLIGEVSKLFNISKQTLRYYDSIDLLKPNIIDKNTNYRYYTIDQFEKLNTIIYLKILGFSLKKIKNYLDNRRIDNAIKLLEDQKNIIDEKINNLNLIKSRIDKKIKYISNVYNTQNKDIITLKLINKRNIVSIDLRDTENEFEVEMILSKVRNSLSSNIFISSSQMGVIIAKENIINNVFNKFKSIYFIIDDDIKINKEIKTIEENYFVTTFHKGPYFETHKTYKKLKDYIKKNNLIINGDAMEISHIDSFIEGKEKYYITEIQIPVK
ncbi:MULTISPECIES: MerR family transcriptional regulator [Oceanotoga]|jgi:DNA-binding transcriptional MerR regulator|uniref:DNA-binding transcriptional MerR regulator n=1 Tax=Oceanotoga teriensis TaxID=515440 RepID=A0AA45HJP5_9BACT|nr:MULTISPECIES: MerR family transcriptional regulator [Oceanotoga]MDN5343760.1 hypothetical protein [Oceanotoga sp.]MDO7975547.1 MerR family transcriptional regulator [Oceanotoga teriensis]PWJ96165.1 DNA-binding transcriptional MerR regulator [Oceanotoga teriensis]